MKARVKAMGVELEVHPVDKQARYIGSDGVTYWEEDLDFGIEDKNNPDYWTRLEHTYAGMAMQGILTDGWGSTYISNPKSKEQHLALVTNAATEIAHALVEKMKEGRE